jgi:hypothetical protein
MALKKDIKQADGVTTSYHRILYVMQTVNSQTSIAVISYVDEEAREAQKSRAFSQPYSKAKTYETEYSPSMTVETAYDYLKTLPEFEGATDI